MEVSDLKNFEDFQIAQGTAKLLQVKVRGPKKWWKMLPTTPLTKEKKDQKKFRTSNFDLWYFCIPFSYTDAQYIIWKSSQL